MTMFVLNRNFTLTTTKGHIIGFEKNKPVNVPREVQAEALSIGAEPQEDVEFDDEKLPVELTPEEREKAINAAVVQMVAENKQTDFTANGVPNTSALSKRVGFKVDSSERDAAWVAHLEAVATK